VWDGAAGYILDLPSAYTECSVAWIPCTTAFATGPMISGLYLLSPCAQATSPRQMPTVESGGHQMVR